MKRFIKRSIGLILSIIIAVSIGNMCVLADDDLPYITYTYTRSGDMVLSPDVYTVSEAITLKDSKGVAVKYPKDFSVDSDGNFWVADTDNNRVICFSASGKELWAISEFSLDGKKYSLSSPQCVQHAFDGSFYISDSGELDESGTPLGNGRIFKFDSELKAVRLFEKPQISQLANDGISYNYNPVRFAVDAAGRIYVIADGVNQGFIQLNKKGEFQGFIGAPDVTYNVWELIVRKFSTKAQKERMQSFVPTEYCGVDIDADDGFLFAATKTYNQADVTDLISSQLGNGASAASNPSAEMIRKLNASGEDVLRRKGAFSPVGDILIPDIGINGSPKLDKSITRNQETVSGSSRFTDICSMSEGMYAAVDTVRNRVFVYDYDSNLICAFGGAGTGKTSFSDPTAICFFNDTLFILNSQQGTISTCALTEYGKTLIAALHAQYNSDTETSLRLWGEILEQNSNCELAYDAIGRAYLDNEDAVKAMQYFKLSSNHSYYSQAYKINRDNIIGDYFVWIIIGILAFLAAFSFAVKGMKKLAKKSNPIGKAFSKINYCFYTLIHPFDGFYCLKHENRGSLILGFAQIFILGISSVLCTNASGYNFNFVDVRYENVFFTFLTVVLPYLLFTVSNWCLITLFDGKGTYKDIVVLTGCSTIPLAIANFIYFALSFVCVADEAALMTVFTTIGTVWMIFLFFTATISVHDYTPAKAVISLVCTIFGIVIIVFVILFFYDVISSIAGFAKMLYSDLSVR